MKVLWDDSLEVVKDTEMRSRIQGISSCMKSFDFYFGVSLGELLLKHSDNLSKTLQSSGMSAAEGQKIADITVRSLNSIRTDDNFSLFWKLIKQKSSNLNINEPVLPRRKKRPRRYEDGASEGKFPESLEDLYRCTYFEALDLLVCGIKQRFDQPGYKVYSNLEGVLVKAAKIDNYDHELQYYVVDFYKGDSNREQLSVQLVVLSNNISSDSA